jgi:glycosyltransferase involved in cell wall biosynthesis
VVRQLKKDGVEVFHGLSHELPIGLTKAGIKSVVSMHDLIFMRYPELYPASDRLFYEQKYRRAAEAADCVVAISEQTRSDLEQFFKISPQKVRIIGQSCDAAFDRLSLRQQPGRLSLPLPAGTNLPATDYLISVGSLTPRKNWHNLLQAMAILKTRGTDLPLVAVGTGKGAYAEGLRKQAQTLGLHVFWLDQHLPTEDLALLYRRAAAMVYPSVFEGFGIPILEAMTVGVPVITTKGGCFEEVGGAGALYASPESPEAIAAQIAKSLDAQIRQSLTDQMPTQIAQFSPERISAAWMDVYYHLKK